MNKLKFRLWDIKEKTWLPITTGFGIQGVSGGIIDLNKIFNKDYIIQQFTGLLDINDKEIYDGDIIEWKEPINWDKNPPTVTKVLLKYRGAVTVDIARGSFVTLENTRCGGRVLRLVDLFRKTVVGNIFNK